MAGHDAPAVAESGFLSVHDAGRHTWRLDVFADRLAPEDHREAAAQGFTLDGDYLRGVAARADEALVMLLDERVVGLCCRRGRNAVVLFDRSSIVPDHVADCMALSRAVMDRLLSREGCLVCLHHRANRASAVWLRRMGFREVPVAGVDPRFAIMSRTE